jgi:hypothetical protein
VFPAVFKRTRCIDEHLGAIKANCFKSDIEAAVKEISALFTSRSVEQNLISVELPERYWVLVLAALEPQMIAVRRAIEQLKEAGHSFETVSEISEELRTGLVGTIMARGTIVDKLVERGVMRPEAARY